MNVMKSGSTSKAWCAVLLMAIVALPLAAKAPKPPKSLRLYVFDCGKLTVDDPARFGFKKEELAVLDLSVGCYLIVHPKGTLVWDTGAVPDSAFTAGGTSAKKEYATATSPLKTQLAGIGYAPGDIKYLALSHAHWDHVANASEFAGSTWLEPKIEHDAFFAEPLPVRTDASMFVALKNTKTVSLPDSDYDVFGDGTVMIKPAPGHTPGHRVLFLKLAKTGPVVLSGDIYHYPEEVSTHRMMTTEFNADQTAASRASLQAFMKQSGAQLWIQHDLAGFQKLKKAPQFYE